MRTALRTWYKNYKHIYAYIQSTINFIAKQRLKMTVKIRLILCTLFVIHSFQAISMTNSLEQKLIEAINDYSIFKDLAKEPENDHAPQKMLECYNSIIELLEQGANPNTSWHDHTTPLIFTLENELPQITSALLKYNANVNFADSQGDTPLIRSLKRCKEKNACFLIAHSADVNAKGNGGKTALMVAVAVMFSGTEDLLLKHNADLDIQDDEGNTALIHLVKINYDIPQRDNGYKRIKILDYYPNCSLKNNNGQTALDIARKNNNAGLIEQLSNVPKLEKLP